MKEKKIGVFFGHRDAPDTLRVQIEATILHLLNDGISCFYVGNHGRFDSMVMQALKQISSSHALTYAVAVTSFDAAAKIESHPTVLPEGVEIGPPRFAIDRRNRWMVRQADVVIAYVTRDFGGAAKYLNIARRKGATVINLGELPSPATSALP